MNERAQKNWAGILRHGRKEALIDLLRFYGATPVEEGEDGLWMYRIDDIKGHWVEELFHQNRKQHVHRIDISISNIVQTCISYSSLVFFKEASITMGSLDLVDYTYEDLAEYIENKMGHSKEHDIFDEPFRFLEKS